MLRHTVCAIALILAASAAFGLPSFRGYTGLMLMPTADSLCRGNWSLGVFFEDVSSGVVNDFTAHYGIADGLEVGFTRYREDNDHDADTFLNAKYAFVGETESRPQVAAGIIDLTGDQETTVYVVASKSLSTPLGVYEGQIINPRIHVGFGGGEFSPLFAGISAYLGNRLELMAEWDSDDTQIGARWRITPGLTVHAGFFDIFDDGTFGAGVSFGRYY